MRRIAVLGRGGSGKSVLARRLAATTGLPVVELDAHFWRPGPTATPADEWASVQAELIGADAWIADGDLGHYDSALSARLLAADLIVVLDFGLVRCAWQAARRALQRRHGPRAPLSLHLDFWRWLVTYRRRSLLVLTAAIATHGQGAEVRVLRTPRSVQRFVEEIAGRGSG